MKANEMCDLTANLRVLVGAIGAVSLAVALPTGRNAPAARLAFEFRLGALLRICLDKKNTQDATPTAISNHTQLTNQTQQQIMQIYPPRGRACRQLAWHPYWTTSHDTPALVRFLELAGGFLGSFSLLRSRVYLEERFSLPSFEQRCHSPTPSQKINYFL